MENIMQHFRKDEQPFIETAIGWIRDVDNSYAPKLTDFLDPRERFIVESLVSGTDLLMESSGVFSESERMRVLLYPNYYTPEEQDFQVAVFSVKYASKFLTIEHKDVLGSLMSLGLERYKFGDIHLQDDEVQFAVVEELKDYIKSNFTSIGKAKIAIIEVEDAADLIVSESAWIEMMNIVSSLRLDTILASLLSVSRQKAVSLIRGDKVRVNWTSVNDPSVILYESDILSIRGSGRFKVVAIEGRTRKDNIKLLTGKLE